MLIPRFVQCVTGLFRLLLACSWVVPLVTDLFLACSACYWLVPLVPCFRNVAREILYNELGWESLSSRRWSRRLILLYKFINNLTPDYTRDPIPPLHGNNYPFRNPPVVGQIRARTEKFKSSFFPHSLTEWNKLDPEIRESSSVSVLKKKLFSQIRPPANSVYGIHNPKGISFFHFIFFHFINIYTRATFQQIH